MNAYQTGPTGTNPKGYGGEVSDTSSERQGYDEDGNARPWTVLPGGRGSEQHGVPFTGTPDNDGYSEGDSSGVSGRGALGDNTVPIEPLATEPEPIPVRVVQQGGREVRTFRVTRAYAGDSVQNVAGMNLTRSEIRLRNLSSTATDRVWLSDRADLAGPATGYPLDPGAEIILDTQKSIHILRDPSSATNPIPVAVLIAHAIEES